MLTPSHDWTTTGLFWDAARPALWLADTTGAARRLPAGPRSHLAIGFTAPRRCIGWWVAEAARRRPCPNRELVPADGVAAQCGICSAADPGRAFARDQVVDDGRRHALYLAWFGPGLLKVGMTAIERGSDRLAEQGALAYSWLAEGPMPAVRHAEQQVSAAGLAPQRRSRSTKVEAWWSMPAPETRALELAAAHARIAAAIDWPDHVELRDNTTQDNVAGFGLTDLPDTYREVTEVTESAALVGTVIAAVGRELLVDTASSGPVLTDTRLLAGRTCYPVNDPTGTGGLTLQPRTRPRSTHAGQDILF